MESVRRVTRQNKAEGGAMNQGWEMKSSQVSKGHLLVKQKNKIQSSTVRLTSLFHATPYLMDFIGNSSQELDEAYFQ